MAENIEKRAYGFESCWYNAPEGFYGFHLTENSAFHAV